MAFRIEVYEGDTVDRVLELTDEAAAAYDLTGKVVTLDIAAYITDDTPLLSKTTATAAEMEHDDAGGNVTVHMVAGDYTYLVAVDGGKVGSVAGTLYAASLRVDGDTVEVGDVFVKANVPRPAV